MMTILCLRAKLYTNLNIIETCVLQNPLKLLPIKINEYTSCFLLHWILTIALNCSLTLLVCQGSLQLFSPFSFQSTLTSTPLSEMYQTEKW